MYDEKDIDFDFYFNPFIEKATEIANYATFDDYNALLDADLSEPDRRFYW